MRRHFSCFLLLLLLIPGFILAFAEPCLPAPTITSINPTSGPTTGGTEVTVYGSGFVVQSNVFADSFYSWTVKSVAEDGTWITCTTSGHPAGVVYVSVSNPDYQFATLEEAFTYFNTPMVTTSVVSNISSTSANGGGQVTSDGGSAVTQRGVCWSTSANPTVALPTKTVDGSGDGSFVSIMTGLSPNTPYHVRAYATNSAETGYGSDVSFNTASSSILYVSESGCGVNTPCYPTIQAALDAAEEGALIKVAQSTPPEPPVWSKTGTVTISGGWNDAFTQQTGTTEMYAPKATATGGGAVKVQPNIKMVSP